jgi:flagellar biosynthesis GTPase FlhF
MRIIRFVAADTRQALRGVRAQLGEHAVILSSKRTDEGVEVTAGADIDAPQAQATSLSLSLHRRSRIARNATGSPSRRSPPRCAAMP